MTFHMMRTLITLLFLTAVSSLIEAQHIRQVTLDTLEIGNLPQSTGYKGSAPRYMDIVHMELEITPDFKTKTADGQIFILAKPHHSGQDSISLDAKGMVINKVNLFNGKSMVPLRFRYDMLKLNIRLDRTYSKDEEFMLYIEYVAQPYKLSENGIELSAGRGLYFIDPEEWNPYKKTMLWTQGETNANSVWFPTIDEPNEQLT